MIRGCKLLLLLSILLAVSCVDKQPQEMIKKSFTAQMEGFDHPVKTSLGEKNSVIWSTGDCISIFEGSSRADQYLILSATIVPDLLTESSIRAHLPIMASYPEMN